MRLYAITDRRLLPGRDPERLTTLVELARTWAKNNVDYIQIREKDLGPSELRDLTRRIVTAVRKENHTTRVLLNGPAQIAFETHADGIHLPANSLARAAEDARNLFDTTGGDAIISHSCHSAPEVLKAKEQSQQNPLATTTNTLILYAPVFEKAAPGEKPLPGLGLESLRAAVQSARPIPVFALGGVTQENAPTCIAAGAAGVAAIRFLLGDHWQIFKAILRQS